MKKTIVLAMMLCIAAIGLATSCSKDDDENNNTNVEWVDLGLPSGLLWCSHNVGATNPEEYGDYYAWGETAPKSTYSWDTYKYCEDGYMLTKYCTNTTLGNYGYNGFIDNKTTLESSDDAARVNMGIGIRTPTKAEWEELFANTSIEGVTVNGVKGIRFAASNGNSIFLPAAGARVDNDFLNYDVWCYYWSSSLVDRSPLEAWSFTCYPETHPAPRINNIGRRNGNSVRAVRSVH